VTYWLKIVQFFTPLAFDAHSKGDPLEFRKDIPTQKTRMMRLSGGGRILTICFATLTQLHMRDRQTNRQTSGSKLAPSCALRSISTYKILTSTLIDKSVKVNSHSHPGDHQKMHNTLMPCL